jgi:hypothetical protein
MNLGGMSIIYGGGGSDSFRARIDSLWKLRKMIARPLSITIWVQKVVRVKKKRRIDIS